MSYLMNNKIFIARNSMPQPGHIVIAWLFFSIFTVEATARQHDTQPDSIFVFSTNLITEIKETYFQNNLPVLHKMVSFQIPEGDTVQSNMLLVNGDLRIYGIVQGTVVIVDGNVYLGSKGLVEQDVICINGRINRERFSKIAGRAIETVLPTSNLNPQKTTHKELQLRRRPPDTRELLDWDRSIKKYARMSKRMLARYNRVEGLFAGSGFQSPLWPVLYPLKFGLSGFAGFGLSNEKWRYQANIEAHYESDVAFAFGYTHFDYTDSQDHWRISREENSLAALIAGSDFMDYFQRTGSGIYAMMRFQNNLAVQGGYFVEKYAALARQNNWSLIGKNASFRPNPAIESGEFQVIKTRLQFDSRDNADTPIRGLLATAVGEYFRPAVNSSLSSSRLTIDLRYFSPISPGENLDIRLRFAVSSNNVPRQYLFHLGGLSSLRGYRHKEFVGNKMLLANCEYRLNAGHSRSRFVWPLQYVDFIVFMDMGMIGFDNFTVGDFKNNNGLKADWGFAITDGNGKYRLNFARRVDGKGDDLVVSIRLNRPF